MTNKLSDLKVTDVEKVTDSVGGVQLLDSGVYPVTIKAMFLGMSSSKARSVTVHATTKEGVEFKTTQYVTSGEAKGGKPYYVRNSKKYFLPGYNVINAICVLATGKEIFDMELEEKVINLYDYDAGREIPSKVDMFVEALGQKVALGIQKQIVDKNKKDDVTGEYEPTGETREINELSAVFCIDTGRTLSEVQDDIEEPKFLETWKKKWDGQVINKAKGLEGSTGAIPKKTGNAAKPSKSLFS